MNSIQAIVSSPKFSGFIALIIILNAITLGLETSASIKAAYGPALHAFDTFALSVYCIEIALKLVAERTKFFRSGWNWFDVIVVSFAFLPDAGPLAVLRSLRVLRVFRLFSVLGNLKRIVGALLGALPSLGAIVLILIIWFYVCSVMATTFFGPSFPDWFGTIGKSLYTLFQVMTLESWSMGIVRPVLEVFPYAWVFFVPFIVISTFTVLNLFIAVLVSSIQTVHESELVLKHAAHEAHDNLEQEIKQIEQALEKIKSRLSKQNSV